MRLTKLELSGFKSFADTVTLSFDAGVTAIVGPNGCGKSNVSDAVRWVLGEQSARLLRGGKMEDVIFQGAATRRPVNVTEVSLYLDNSDGDLPIAYQEVVITRRLSRSGQSEYLINGTNVRLRDVQDLLRGTGLGGDAGVVIEARMIDLLLSDRADERRSLFEEASGIGLYRDRKHTTERRLEETSADLQRVEDVIAEVQSQLRSLARQRGKAERHAKLMEEKFAVQLTLARRRLEHFEEEAAALTQRREELATLLPATRERLARQTAARDAAAQARTAAESERTEIARRLGAVRVELGKLDGDIALAAERLANAAQRRLRATEEQAQMTARVQQAALEVEEATAERAAAETDHGAVQRELGTRAAAEAAVRERLAAARNHLRELEAELYQSAQAIKSLEGERAALESELASLREQETRGTALRAQRQTELTVAEERREQTAAEAAKREEEARLAAAEVERLRHQVAELREHESTARAARRQAEESLAQVTARRQALEELERDRVGLAPGAAALLAARDRFGDGILGPLSDFLSTSRDDAELAERLLGEWVHAVLVRDLDTAHAIQQWHAETQPGMIVLLPGEPTLDPGAAQHPLQERLRAEGRAGSWVTALLSGAEVLDPSGRALRRGNGAILLSGAASPSGPLRRRAELAALVQDCERLSDALAAATAELDAATARLAEAEAALRHATAVADAARGAERSAVALREDAQRAVQNITRELGEADTQLTRLRERLARAEQRLAQVGAELKEREIARARQDEALGTARAALAELEGEQERAREDRVHWQVQEAHVAARLRAAAERVERARKLGAEAEAAIQTLGAEIARLEADSAARTAQQAEWIDQRAEKRVAALELEAAAADADQALAAAGAALTEAEQGLAITRAELETLSEEDHRLQLRLTEIAGQRRSIAERVETEWRKPLDELLETAPVLDLDLETLESESARIVAALESIGPVNPLAVEEHAEETKRLEFLISQRDDLVAARQSLLQAIREIDGTARAMFMETFTAVQSNFTNVFQTLFGGGECELRLANPDDPLESEIEIHAAPRGKRTQRIHLLSSGERTLVATSLLFAIYLTKPSPFCLMDEVDAPLDDANVTRFTRLLDEFKHSSQFIVITHNPRTMQAADAVYGVTMQEPGVSTIVGVRLGDREGVS
ncbi:MAG: chromosome segregation protein SMC [Gemmatimonadota bacterium]